MVLLHLVPASRQVRLAGNTQPLVSDGKLTVGILMSDTNVQYQAFVRRKQDVSHTINATDGGVFPWRSRNSYT